MSLLKTQFGKKGISQCISFHLLHAYEYTKFTSGSEIKWLLWLRRNITHAALCGVSQYSLFISSVTIHSLLISSELKTEQSFNPILLLSRMVRYTHLLTSLLLAVSTYHILILVFALFLFPFKSVCFHMFCSVF